MRLWAVHGLLHCGQGIADKAASCHYALGARIDGRTGIERKYLGDLVHVLADQALDRIQDPWDLSYAANDLAVREQISQQLGSHRPAAVDIEYGPRWVHVVIIVLEQAAQHRAA